MNIINTDEINNENIPDGKVYHIHAIWIGALIGGPLVAGYFLAKNFNTFNEISAANASKMLSLIFTLIILTLIYLLNDYINIPRSLWSILYSAIAIMIFKYYQEKKVNEHLQNGGFTYDWVNVVVYTLIGFVFTLFLTGYLFFWGIIANAFK